MGSCSSTPETPPKLQDRHWNPRLYHGNDSYLQRYVAVSRTYHEGLITLIESEGCDAARFLSPALFPYNSETTRQALRGTPFYTIYKHIVALGLTPQVYLEPQLDDNNNLLVCLMGTYEDIDWISLLLSDHDKFVRITRYSDVTLHNFGRMMVIAPQLFKYYCVVVNYSLKFTPLVPNLTYLEICHKKPKPKCSCVMICASLVESESC